MIAERVSMYRTREGLTQGQLATYAAVSRSYITRLEAGDFRDHSVEKLARIAHALGRDVGDLVSTDEGDTSIQVPRRNASLLRRWARRTRDELERIDTMLAIWDRGRVSEDEGAGGKPEHQHDADHDAESEPPAE